MIASRLMLEMLIICMLSQRSGNKNRATLTLRIKEKDDKEKRG